MRVAIIDTQPQSPYNPSPKEEIPIQSRKIKGGKNG